MEKPGRRESGMFSRRQRLGGTGETYAARFLRERGYRIVTRNFRARRGEIDIVAEDGETLVFVEVKTRDSSFYGRPFEAVDRRKQGRMVHAALTYMKRLDRIPPCRFDVVSIENEGGILRAVLIRDAFELPASL